MLKLAYSLPFPVHTSDGLLPTPGNEVSSSVLNTSTSYANLSSIPYCYCVTIPWVIDIGTTDHTVSSISFLTSISSSIKAQVKLLNGKYASVTLIGTVKLSASLTLSNVFCVPSFGFNLISVSQYPKFIPCCLIFVTNFYFIQDLFP